jgi:fluoride ion exporter CrcB/FEX
MLFSTPGALLRWKLGAWYNGKLPIPTWAWLPLGTLLANAIGSIVSMSMIGWEFNLQISNVTGYWSIATVRAIKIGFSGCLTTVSTFVSEIHSLSNLRQGRGYKYAIVTLVLCCCLAMIMYAVIV